ncbi:MAG TPA: ComF family protein [Vitreimonas sp.]|nr:ComF family protein [Vitreimonas sp.]
MRNIIWQLFLELLYPVSCCGCQQTGSYLCAHCYEHLEFFPLPIPIENEPCYLDQVWACARYQWPLTQLIHAMKYQSVKGIGRFGGRLLFETVTIPPIDAITAVPLHSYRLRRRGFNQAEEIALSLAKLIQRPYYPLLIKTKMTATQATSDKKARLSQLHDVFCWNAALRLTAPPHTCLIIDDVFTTGATLNECARILKAQGVTTIYGLTLSHEG